MVKESKHNGGDIIMRKLKIAAIGTEHRHIFGQLKGMLDLGCECVGWWNDGDNKITDDFNEKSGRN